MTDEWPPNAWWEPASPRRFLLWFCTLLAISAAGYFDVVPVRWALSALAISTFIFLWWERSVHERARRDAFTDLSQAIHDGNIGVDDLRRVRGYEEIEKKLRRIGVEERGGEP